MFLNKRDCKIKFVTAMAAHCDNCTNLKPELGRLDCKARILRLEIAQIIRLEWGWGEG